MEFPGRVHYAATAAEVDEVAERVLSALPRPATIGIDFEWWFNERTKETGPIAAIQLCWEEGGGELHAAVLHVAQLAPRASASCLCPAAGNPAVLGGGQQSIFARLAAQQAVRRSSFFNQPAAAVAPGRMTPKLRQLLEDGSVRKITFGNFDQRRFEATYGWRVTSMVDLQPCFLTAFRSLLTGLPTYPRLAEAAVWVLGHDVDKRLQTSNGWEEARPLSAEEIAYAATDAYAHLMLWRASLCFSGQLQHLPVVPSRAAATAAEADKTATVEHPAAAGKRARQDGASGSEPPCKRLAPHTEEQEHEAALAWPSQQEDEPQGGSDSKGGSAAGDGADQGVADAAELAAWKQRMEARYRIYSTWPRTEPWEAVEARRQRARHQWLASKEGDPGFRGAPAAGAQLERLLAPEQLPLADPAGAEQLARRLVQVTPSALQ